MECGGTMVDPGDQIFHAMDVLSLAVSWYLRVASFETKSIESTVELIGMFAVQIKIMEKPSLVFTDLWFVIYL
jgi:hypothetical protein